MPLAADLTIRRFSPQTVPDHLRIAYTPWGKVEEYTYVFAPGEASDAKPLLLVVATASHGGMCPCEDILARIPVARKLFALRWNGAGINGSLWFEEDCAWAAVALAAPELFDDDEIAAAEIIAAHHIDART